MRGSTIRAVLFDRDGTLIEDVPHNGDADRVRPMPGARESVDLPRSRRVRTGVVTNQSGLGRGLLAADELDVFGMGLRDLNQAGCRSSRPCTSGSPRPRRSAPSLPRSA